MPSRKYYIELNCPAVDDVRKFDAVTRAIQIACRQLHAQATLVLGGPTPPTIEIIGEDLQTGRMKIPMGKPDAEEE